MREWPRYGRTDVSLSAWGRVRAERERCGQSDDRRETAQSQASPDGAVLLHGQRRIEQAETSKGTRQTIRGLTASIREKLRVTAEKDLSSLPDIFVPSFRIQGVNFWDGRPHRGRSSVDAYAAKRAGDPATIDMTAVMACFSCARPAGLADFRGMRLSYPRNARYARNICQAAERCAA